MGPLHMPSTEAWRGCQVHTGRRIRGQAAVGARLGHRMLNREAPGPGLGAQPAPGGHCCHQAEGQGAGSEGGALGLELQKEMEG